MEAAYRSALTEGCPEAADDRTFYRAVVEACAYWTLGMCHWAMPNVLQEDQEWGIATWRQRVLLRLDILMRTADELGRLEALGLTVRRVAAELRSRWPSDVDAMPPYPAFRESGDSRAEW